MLLADLQTILTYMHTKDPGPGAGPNIQGRWTSGGRKNQVCEFYFQLGLSETGEFWAKFIWKEMKNMRWQSMCDKTWCHDLAKLRQVAN